MEVAVTGQSTGHRETDSAPSTCTRALFLFSLVDSVSAREKSLRNERRANSLGIEKKKVARKDSQRHTSDYTEYKGL